MKFSKVSRYVLNACFFAAGVPAVLLGMAWMVMSVVLPTYTPSRKFLGVAVGVTILFHFVLTTIVVLRKAAETHLSKTIIVVVGLAIALLGSAWLVWTIHLGANTGDWEYYGIMSAMAAIGQGVASVLIMHDRNRLTT